MIKRLRYLGEEIEIEVLGKGPALIFLHGFLGNKELFKPLAKRFVSSNKVVIIDLPGHGNSSSLAYVHSMELMAKMVKAVLDQLKIRRVTLVGHSMGGYVSLAFAELFTDQVKSMVLVNSTAAADTKEKINSRTQFIALLKKNKDKALRMLVPTFFNYKAVRQRQWIKSYLKSAERADLRGIVAAVEGMKKRAEREIVLKFAPYPFLIIGSKFDTVITSDALIQQAQLNSLGNFVELKNSSHMSFMEEEAELFKVIKTFLKRKSI